MPSARNKMVDWSKLSPSGFELLCERLLRLCGFSDVKWFGESGGEKGRDLIGYSRLRLLPGEEERLKWVVQCKRYISRRISKTDLADFFTAAREHKPDRVLLITTIGLTPDTKDWLDSVRGEYNFKISVWEPTDLDAQLRENKSKLFEEFRDLYSTGEIVAWGQTWHSEYNFCCAEFDEIEIRIHNKENAAEAAEELARFLDFIRGSDFRVFQ